MAAETIPVGVSARHVHLSEEHLEALFGAGFKLTVMKQLSQPGQYAAQETVDLETEKGSFKKVRILGPVRKNTQVELAFTDAIKLGLNPPVRDSGDHRDSPGITIVGPKGKLKIDRGVIIAWRHIHMTPEDAARFGVHDKDFVKAACGGERGLIFENVLIRVHPEFKLEMHVDTDEANAAMLKTGQSVSIIK